MKRRTLLGSIGVTMVSGCASTDRDTPTVSSTTGDAVTLPTVNDCEPVASLRPTPATGDARAYPSIPDRITRSSSEQFATSYERAFQYNAKRTRYERIEVDTTVPAWALVETDTGYAVGLDARVQFDDGRTPSSTETPYPSGGRQFAVWYHLSDRVAFRGETLDGLDQTVGPRLADASVVACDEKN